MNTPHGPVSTTDDYARTTTWIYWLLLEWLLLESQLEPAVKVHLEW